MHILKTYFLYYVTGTEVLITHILELNMVTFGFKIANALHHIAMNIGGRGGGRTVERGC